jgi:PEP-CTERM motif
MLCAIAAFTAIHGHAQITNYNTLVEPGDGYNSFSVYDVIGSSVDFNGNGYQSLAFEFTPSVSGNLAQINLAVFGGNANLSQDQLNVYVANNAGNLPGSIVDSFLNVPVAQGASTDIPLTSVNSVNQPYLQAGTPYWLMVEAANPNGLLVAFETTHGITSSMAALFSPTGNWRAEGTRGTLAFDVVDVPEPSTWILFAIGAAALLRIKGGQKRGPVPSRSDI